MGIDLGLSENTMSTPFFCISYSIVDDVLEDFLFSEMTISFLKSLKFKKHFILTLAPPQNVQIQFQEILFFKIKMTELATLTQIDFKSAF